MDALAADDPAYISDYRLLGRLGRGSMGAVYLGRSRGGRVVAVKMARAELAEDREFRERFRREVRMASAVGGFWTATVVDADTEGERPWLATEYVPGPTLQQAVAEYGPLPETSVRALAAGLAEALQAVHTAGLVHRDLKPSNVLLAPDGPRVIDFGISRAMAGSQLTATGMFFGTPGYFSPEQTSGGEISAASDVFSLGAVLAFACTGRCPFSAEHTAGMLYRVVNTAPDLDDVPPQLRSLIEPCLAKDPAQRPTPATLLDSLGGGQALQGDWLPAPVTSLINEHTAQLGQLPAATSPAGAAAGRPGTRAYTGVAAAPAADAGARSAPAQSGSGATAHADAPEPASSAAASGRERQRESNGGAQFSTGGRVRALVSAVIALLLLAAFVGLGASARYWATQAMLAAHRQGIPSGQSWQVGSTVGMVIGIVAVIGMVLFGLRAVFALLRTALPSPRLIVNDAGLTVARGARAQRVAWSGVARVRIVGRGSKRHVVAWLVPGTRPPKSTPWHRLPRQNGGVRLYRLGRSGGSRRRELEQLRAALGWYAPRAYDGRL